ncbi:hypothetical protein HPB50_011085 [Hyalomma asiaticum]|uniref:Uncharacterized protein n=1 Tax=Hyalomma asiaticum TaxID=266040 RepID=A0ACB7RY69_HYAAI|nr:hypothetical protein HPB50_011085 [Hyalomma asiaticum]
MSCHTKQKQVEIQDTADITSRGIWKINIKISDYEKRYRELSSSKAVPNDSSENASVLMEKMLKAPASQIEQHGQLLAIPAETLHTSTGPKVELAKPDMFVGGVSNGYHLAEVL